MRNRRQRKHSIPSVRKMRYRSSMTIMRTCMITWIVLLTCFGLIAVEEQAVTAGYLEEGKLLSVQKKEPFETEICWLGDRYVLDWAPLNQAAERVSPYFTLIPAPFRLPYQLMLYVEERYEADQKEQREREFIENI